MFEILLVIATITIIALGIILGEGTLRDKADEMKSVALRYIIYSALDWGLMFLSIALVTAMKSIDANVWVTTLAMWIFDLVTAAALYYICLKSGEDLTLGRQYRKSYILILQRSKIAGYSAFILLFVKSAIWDGPERLVEFWHIELKNKTAKALLILALVAIIQAIFWTLIYWFGLEMIF